MTSAPHLTKWQARRRRWKKLNQHVVTFLFILLAITVGAFFVAFVRSVAPAFGG